MAKKLKLDDKKIKEFISNFTYRNKKSRKLRNTLIFIFLLFFIDLLLTQLFLFNFYYKKLEKQYASDIENRIPNKNYKYTFAKKKSFKSNYQGREYIVKTNNLGFRDSEVRDLDKNNYYTIVIGDSFVEGVSFEFEDTLVGHLNKKLSDKKVKNHEFLNAGVASYSTYIYQKKIIKILDENPWLKTNMVILLLDKSDVMDDLSYLDRPEYFPLEKRKYKTEFKDEFFYDLKKLYLWRFIYKQTTTGAFIKKMGDIVELEMRNLRDKYKLSKKLGKSFFNISLKQVKSFRSINTKTYIADYFYGNVWKTDGKKSVDFSIENLMNLKNYLENKNIKLFVVLYPWPFEIADKVPRENYLNYIIPKLEKKKINYTTAYKYFLRGDIYSKISDNYIYNDVHLNKNGNKILSDIIWEKIFIKF